ncbi:TetR/AcrR family transcriptional regulator [Nocardia elegans]|uniref:TetR/AcrR family transcriptional regulator n=1 Tax=Nocardia elegans TaxID=300029 RepID=UPI001895309A|nr:TetR/AcrR family transcriptional regulator [Nocardia elegans]MBF6245782.1 TetR/AcrR family transcriptional regulator [Nocardia elegans]
MKTGASPRRTQAQRTEETRQRLISATIRAIRDDGYRATTTRRVADYAGVSLGAVAHHFPNRAALISAALDAVASRLIASVEDQARTLATGGPIDHRALLDTLWASFTGESFLVWIRVWLAASEDPDVRDAAVEADRHMSANLARVLPPLAPDGLSTADWMRRLNVVLDAMRGLSLMSYYQPGHEDAPDRWPSARRELLRLLAP